MNSNLSISATAKASSQILNDLNKQFTIEKNVSISYLHEG